MSDPFKKGIYFKDRFPANKGGHVCARTHARTYVRTYVRLSASHFSVVTLYFYYYLWLYIYIARNGRNFLNIWNMVMRKSFWNALQQQQLAWNKRLVHKRSTSSETTTLHAAAAAGIASADAVTSSRHYHILNIVAGCNRWVCFRTALSQFTF